MHCEPPSQEIPQPPQFFLSRVVSMQAPASLQLSRVPLHAHAPPLQVDALGQAAPHAPQLP